MRQENLDKLINEALAIEAREAKDVGALGYMARVLVQATMPHSKPLGNEFTRQNGLFSLSMLAPEKIGLPFGSIPRLLIAWITTEAVRTNQKEISLGNNLSQFMYELGLVPTGGRWGTVTRLREQTKRLFSASVSCSYDDGKHWAIKNVQPVSQSNLWWDPVAPHQTTLFQSTLVLGEDLFKEIINRPIPIDMDVVKAIKKSPLALDIYCWLTYRLSYLKKNTTVPWKILQLQFGADYASNSQGTRNFKKAFLRELKKVTLIYRQAKLESSEEGLDLKPSTSHIKKLI